MNATEAISRLVSEPVRSSGLFSDATLVVPTTGASESQLRGVYAQVGRALSKSHASVLASWNGLDLEVIRLFGVPPVPSGIRSLTAWSAVPAPSGWLAFGSDPAGFLYFEDPEGTVHSFDHDGGTWTRIAPSLDAFISEIVFGPAAATFGGEKWLEALRNSGVVAAA